MARKKKQKKQPQTYDAWQGTKPTVAQTKNDINWYKNVEEPKGSPRIAQSRAVVNNTKSFDQEKSEDFKWWINDQVKNGTKRSRSRVLNSLGSEYGKTQADKESTLSKQLGLPATRPASRAGNTTGTAKPKKETSKSKVADLVATSKNSNAPKKEKENKEKGFIGNFMDFVKGFATGDMESATKAGNKQGERMANSKVGSEIDRAATRATNSALLGLPKALDTKAGAKPKEYEKREGQTALGTVGDFVSDSAGYLAPGAAAVKGLRSLGVNKGAATAAKEIAKGNVKGNVGKVARGTAVEGALVGGGISGAEEGIKAAINPDQFDGNQAMKNIALNTAVGAVADPLISLAGPLAKNYMRGRNGQPPTASATATNANPLTELVERSTARPQQSPINDLVQPAKRPTQFTEGTQRITHHDLSDNAVDKILGSQQYNDLSQAEFQLLAKQQSKPLDPTEMNELKSIQQEIDLVIKDAERGTAPKPQNSNTVSVIEREPKKLTPEEASAKLDEMNSPISYRDTSKPKATVKDVAKTFVRSLNREAIDSASDVKAIEKALTNLDVDKVLETLPKGGLKVKDSLYKQARMQSSANARAVNSVKETFTPLYQHLDNTGISDKDLNEYALALHAMDIHKTNAETGRSTVELMDEFDRLSTQRPENMTGKEALEWQKQRKNVLEQVGDLNPYFLPETATPEWAETVLTKWSQNPAMTEAHGRLRAIQDENLQRVLNAGFLDESTVSMLRQRHPNYVSLSRDIGDDTAGAMRGVGTTKANMPTRTRKDGSEDLLVLPILESAMKNHITTLKNAEKNQMMQTIGRYAEIDKGGEMFVKVPEPKPGKTVTAYVDGKQEHYEVPEYLVSYFDKANAIDEKGLISSVGKEFADLVKKGSTHYNIPFHFVSAIRDSASAAMVSRTGQNPVSISMGFLDSFFGDTLEKVTKGKFKSAVAEYEKMGGGASQFISRTDDEIKEMSKAIETGHLNGNKKMIVLNPLKAIEKFGMTMERGARLGEFRQAKGKGYSNEDAFFEATDIMDYSQKGSTVGKLNPYVPYLNAAIRGNSRVFQAMKENPVGFSTKAITYITAPSVALYMSRFAPGVSEEQRRMIENAPDYQKNMYWYAPVPDSDEVMVIPKPHLIGQMFANPAEKMLDQAFGKSVKSKDKDAMQAVKDIASILAPPNSVAGLNTILELSVNKDFFTGYDIESQYDRQAGVPKSEMSNQYTSELAKALGNNVVSPAQIDHTIKKTTGSLGTQALDFTDWVANKAFDTPAKPKDMGDIGGKVVNQFRFNPLNSLGTTAEATKAAAREQAGLSDKEKKALRNSEEPSATAYKKEMKDIDKAVKEIQKDPDMTSEEKKQAIATLRSQQRIAGSSFIDWVNQRGK